MKKTKITKAIFPVAGLGTRFLPATKANPKEMLPIVDKPLVQYAVEEAVAAGITQIIFVTSIGKQAIENHFDSNLELEHKLRARNQPNLLAMVQGIVPKNIPCIYLRQHEQLGLGHAVLCAKNIIDDEPFAVLLADDLIDGDGSYCLQQMVAMYEQEPTSILATQEVPLKDTNKYGIVALDKNSTKKNSVISIIEKPHPDNAPSNLAVIGRYILTPRIFHHLEHIENGAVGEIQLTDGIAKLLQEEPVKACRFKGTRYDCGSKFGYLQATVEYALKHPEVCVEFTKYLREKFKDEITR
jgi:UTP--glucose-1-phosphate uridylyltransferase